MTITHADSPSDQFMKLVHSFPLRPIRSRAAHQRAKSVLRGLLGKRGPATRDYKIVLTSLIAEYERSASLRMNTSRVTAEQVVLHLLEARDMSVGELARALDFAPASLQEMLSGRKEWTGSAIMRISEYLGLHPTLFLRPHRAA